MINIVLFSQDRKLLPLLSSALGPEFQVVLESDNEGMDHLLAEDHCEIALIDLDSSDASIEQKITLAKRMIGSKIGAVIMADDGMRRTAAELVRLGAYSFCRKPPSIRDLKLLLRRAFESLQLQRKVDAEQRQFESAGRCGRMIGSSPVMRQVYDLVHRVADLNASVLVTGESGVGKELIANAIHDLSSRAKRPFVAVSCGAIPETLIEAELFGHEKGAFTGTVGAREGYLEQAADGTLFLDEIGEISLSTQVKLLRVLQQREFNRLGSSRPIPLRARIVFATHENLSDLVAQGKFRLDLYYRINVMEIHAPSLQQRPEDIPALAMHFLRHYSEMYGKHLERIEPGAMSRLEAYSWPGNVRELENVIQRAIIVSRDETIHGEDLLPEIAENDSVANIGDYQAAGSFERLIRDYKIHLAASAVRDHQGNKTMAARSLQISRAYLHRLLRLADQNSFLAEAASGVGSA